jgi:radical SAM protein with 4Fe4S-binding SPASM domain
MRTLIPPLPVEIQAEVTGACNLRCRMCLVRYRPALDRHTASMDLATFRKIVDALPALQRLSLQGIGEPLMAPDLLPMIEYAAQRGVSVGFNTNATLLTRVMAERLVDAGLAWICVSIDGATARTYESIREGASLAKVERHVRTLLEVAREQGGGRPSVALVFVAMRRNVSELPDLVLRAAEWGITEVHVQNLSHSFSDTGGAGAYGDIAAFTAVEALWDGADPAARERARQAFAEARRVAGEAGVSLRLPALDVHDVPRRPGEPGCDWPWRAAYVRHDGKAQPCCMLMGEDRGILGDVHDGIAAVWHGEAYQAFRAALLTDEPPHVCRGCSMYRRVF